MSDVTIKYKGQSIATMDASGTKTLGTQGKYCEGDIGVEYVKPSGPTGTKSISITQNGTTTEDVAAYANAEITVNVQGGGGNMEAFMTRTIADYEDDYTGGISGRYINGDFPNLKRIFLKGYTGFSGAPYYHFVVTGRSDLVIVLPKVADTAMNGCNGCTSLKAFDILLAAGSNKIQQQFWYGCSNFDTLIIRATSGVAELSNINAFKNTPFASGKAGGTLYVPSALVSAYQAATNWSTILGYSTNSIAAIEGSIYETQYADGTPIT